MKILMRNRPGPFQTSGGETIQMTETKRALELMGHSVEFVAGYEQALERRQSGGVSA